MSSVAQRARGRHQARVTRPPGCSAEPTLPAARRPLTSRSRPAATVTMSPVSLLMVNMFWEGLCGLWATMR